MKDKLFWVGLVVFVVSFFVFYPSFFSITDENSYLKTAHYFLEGELVPENVFDSAGYAYTTNGFVTSFYPGSSVVLFPFLVFGWQFIFLSGLLFHLLNVYIFAKILKRYNLPKLYSLLYLLYPGYIFYSRTVMSEIPTITFTLLGFYLFLSKKDILTGFMLGISCLFRPTNALVIVGFALPLLYRKEITRFLKLSFGVFPAFVVAVLYNLSVYEGFLNTRYSGGGTGVYSSLFSLQGYYVYIMPLIILSIVYPLMFVVPFFMKYKHKFVILTTFLLFFLILGKNDTYRYGWMINLVVGHRYFFTVIPLILIPYSKFLNSYFKRLVPVFMMLLILVTPAIMFKQSQYIDHKYEVMTSITSIVPGNGLIVVNGDHQYFNPLFQPNSVVSLNQFRKLKYAGKYYLVDYENKALFSNIQKEGGLKGLEESVRNLDDFVAQNGLNRFYTGEELTIYTN